MRRFYLVLTLAAAGACSEDGPADPCPDTASCVGYALRVINGAGGPVDVRIDGQLSASGVATGAVQGQTVAPGTHQLEVRRSGTATAVNRSVSLSGASATVVVVDSSGNTLSMSALSDTGAVVPAGHTKLRVAHFATGAPAIDVWRSQPDFPTMIRLVFPFTYRFESAYVQSTPGTWRVIISTATDPFTVSAPPDTLADSGPIPIGDGQRRDVVVTDKAGGGLQVVVVEP